MVTAFATKRTTAVTQRLVTMTMLSTCLAQKLMLAEFAVETALIQMVTAFAIVKKFLVAMPLMLATTTVLQLKMMGHAHIAVALQQMPTLTATK
jgi:hypothetical protein